MLQYTDYRKHVDELFRAALEAAEPGRAVRRFLRIEDRMLRVGDTRFDIDQGRIFLIGVGKAALPMAAAAYDMLQGAIYNGGVISKHGSKELEQVSLDRNSTIKVMQGSHPVSGADSLRATAQIVDLLGETTENDLVLCLISGGASALFTQPVVSLTDWKLLINALLASGCTINELNTVRRQLDRVKGGGLARLASPAQCVSLILSDVIGNPLEAIGSGPTVLVSESPADAMAILERYEIADRVDPAAADRINTALLQEEREDTVVPAPGEIIIVGDVQQSATAARDKALELGFDAQVLTVHLEGEAREVGRIAAAIAKDTPPGKCLIMGGETTVTLHGNGLGGRNQEVALAAAISLQDWPAVAVASVATDGEDGPTPAAGAAVSGWTATVALQEDLEPQAYLDRNDSYTFFQELDALTGVRPGGHDTYPLCLVITGSSGTNVNDLLFILTYDGEGAQVRRRKSAPDSTRTRNEVTR